VDCTAPDSSAVECRASESRQIDKDRGKQGVAPDGCAARCETQQRQAQHRIERKNLGSLGFAPTRFASQCRAAESTAVIETKKRALPWMALERPAMRLSA